jgi:hypothetical protein
LLRTKVVFSYKGIQGKRERETNGFEEEEEQDGETKGEEMWREETEHPSIFVNLNFFSLLFNQDGETSVLKQPPRWARNTTSTPRIVHDALYWKKLLFRITILCPIKLVDMNTEHEYNIHDF